MQHLCMLANYGRVLLPAPPNPICIPFTLSSPLAFFRNSPISITANERSHSTSESEALLSLPTLCFFGNHSGLQLRKPRHVTIASNRGIVEFSIACVIRVLAIIVCFSSTHSWYGELRWNSCRPAAFEPTLFAGLSCVYCDRLKTILRS